ncbi:diheme cytochrome c [Paucibacter sp. B2R-40]|uniref:diheme cytochrome c n=1 Tax=Paucibacter sp. B2R-40 TaxID=2893554 RepID=UPI0021E4B020|nr:diheme cytochrome c [Paucibacter sp. B2R-40]MCV2353007.1 diheme cytochrome c [Paucibacter sp. B2R-40]
MKILLFSSLALSLFAAHADEDRGRSGASLPLLPKYQQECSACHLAYPPGMLPAASWQRLMSNLPKHFGSDASLDPATLNELNRWLVGNAGTTKRVSSAPPPEDRISRSSWFVREHEEISAATWQRASIKSAANCAACHTKAEQGDFNEHRVRIPK